MSYDLKIQGGTLYDGSGGDGVRGDLGIRDGKLLAVGDAPDAADRVIDAEGLAVAPGFIDLHTHYDAQVMWDSMLSISPWHGVTSVVMGNCGFGIAPTRAAHRDLMLRTLENVEGMDLDVLWQGLGEDWGFETFPEYLDAIEARGSAINVAALFGHTPLRMYVMGEEATEREATDYEISSMARLVREAMEAGAIGFATSKAPNHVGYDGKPVPSRLAHFDEIRALCRAMGETERGIIMASVGRGLFFKEMAVLAQDSGRPVSWAALLAGMSGPGSHRKMLDTVEQQQADGLRIVPQVLGRPLNFEFNLRDPFLFESLSCFEPFGRLRSDGEKTAFYADPAVREAFLDEAGDGLPPFKAAWFDAVVSYHPTRPEIEGRALSELATEAGTHAYDVMTKIGAETGLKARYRMAVVNTDEDAVAELLASQHTVLGLSDASAHASQLCDACFATDLLQRWVREKEVLTLPQAVAHLTSRPADLYGIADRGRLVEGLAADVTVFDPREVAAGPLHRSADLPGGAERIVSEAFGISAVLCNGRIVRQDGKDQLDPDAARPGRVLRGGVAR